jgi:hypothetical protein
VRSVEYPQLTLTTGRIGLISDTHGLIRPQALAALRGSELIIHGGDIGTPDVLIALENIASVIAIRGNNDHGAWARKLPDVISLHVNTLGIRVIHNLRELNGRLIDGIRVVVSGHSHKPGIISRDRILFINPGSAGPRRFKLPVSVARLKVSGERVRARIVELNI